MRFVLPLALLSLGACVTPYDSPLADLGISEANDATDRTQGDVVQGQWLVKLEGDLDALQASVESVGGSQLEPVDGAPDTFRFSTDAAPPLVGQLAELDGIVGWVEPVVRVYPLAAPPNDPLFELQWHHALLGTLDAWDASQGEGVVVAVVDTGVHDSTIIEDAPLNLLPGISYVDSEIVNDDVGHGTHIANTIAQNANNGIGAAGIAPGVSILPIRALGKQGGTSDDVAAGIRYAVDNGADIINLSLGSPLYSDVMAEACQYARDHGVLVFAASGNDGNDHFVSFPAALESTIAVGAIGPDGLATDYSNRGPELMLTAPGGVYYDYDRNGLFDGILADSVVEVVGEPGYEDGYYTGSFFMSGTSQATAVASASAALLMGAGADADTVMELLQGTAVDGGEPGWDPVYGHGAIDVAAAMAVLGSTEPDPDPEPDPEPECAADACGEALAGLNLSIDEVMANPSTCADAHGEWIEVVNNDAVSVSLDGLQLIDNDGNTGTIHTDQVLLPGQRAVLGRGDPSAFCGPTITGWFDGPSVNNSDEQLCLYTAGGLSVDTGPSWETATSGVSLQRDGFGWVESTEAFGDELATPGTAPEPEIAPFAWDLVYAGEVVVTEIMADPSSCASDSCEWIEIFNTTTQYSFELDGMQISDAASTVTVQTPLVIEPGQRFVFAKGDAASWNHADFVPDGFYGALTLNNGGDDVVLSNATTDVFALSYPADLVESGVSAEWVGTDAENPADWALSTNALSSGEFGTPGF